MLKEKLVTVAIGLVVGAILAGLFFFGPKLVNTKKENKTPKAPIITPKPKPTVFEVTAPEDNSSTTKSEIKVSGLANPNAKIVIFTNADQQQASAAASGKFEITIKLEEGENEIAVTNLTEPIQTIIKNVTLEITP